MVGQVVAQVLDCDHNVIIVKKVGSPGNEEMAVGAIAEDGPVTLDDRVQAENDFTEAELKAQILRTKARVDYGLRLFRRGEPLDLSGRLVILVDDGIATGETMKAALRWVQSNGGRNKPLGVIVAAPVCPQHTADELADYADAVVFVLEPRGFLAVGQFYRHFEQVSDDQVLDLLRHQANSHRMSPSRI